MDHSRFEDLTASLAALDLDLTREQRRILRGELAGNAPENLAEDLRTVAPDLSRPDRQMLRAALDGRTEPIRYPSLDPAWRVVALAILIILFASVLTLGWPIGGTHGLAWMGSVSLWLAGSMVVGYVLWHAGRADGQTLDPINLGIWLWGSVMILIAFNFGAVVLIASQCIDMSEALKPTPDATKLTNLRSTDGCSEDDRLHVIRFYLASKEFSTLIAVMLGFASIAWVNFFTHNKVDTDALAEALAKRITSDH